MGDLTTILGIQLGQKLNEIQNALGDGASYLAAQGRKGGQTTSTGHTQAVSVPAYEGQVVLPDAGFVSKNGKGELAQGSMRPPVSYLPPAGGDPVVTVEQPLIDKRGYLTRTVPVVDERGRVVNMMGPKGSPMPDPMPQPEAAIVPLPNASPADVAGVTAAPYLAPHDHKSKGVFLKHMKSMYEQMLQQTGTLT